MFNLSTIDRIVQAPAFLEDFARVRQGLALHRLGQPGLFDADIKQRLAYLVESVLASVPDWELEDRAFQICRTAAETSELLCSLEQQHRDLARRHRFRAALLYELANCPSIATAVLRADDFSGSVRDFFLHAGPFKLLTNELTFSPPSSTAPDDSHNGNARPHGPSLVESALFSDIRSLAEYEQGSIENATTHAARFFSALGRELSLDYTVTEIEAWRCVLDRRLRTAVRQHVPEELFEQLRAISFPPEFWTTQVKAIKGGLIDEQYDAWGFAAPTGTGKTFLTRLLIARAMAQQPESIILYLVPSRALVYEVSTSLGESLKPLGHTVTAVTPQIVELEDDEAEQLSESSVLVLTPEKADLLLRLGSEVISRASLVIVDEAHHIESSTRGVLLEMYLWRIRRVLKKGRFVFLSAVAPNIGEVVGWLGHNPNSVLAEQRATRMRVGVYRVNGQGRNGTGRIDYSDGTSVTTLRSGVETTTAKQLVQLAASVACAGPVLVVAKGKKECEKLALLMLEWLGSHTLANPLPQSVLAGETIQRLDSRLEREMYPEVELRRLVARGIAYHHAGLPPSVRVAVEDAIRRNLITYVFATTTLAEGVNFPFSTVIVQSLALREPPEQGRPVRYHPVTPRVFWNIAGRAGRPGNDREGQVILFEPSLGLDKIQYVLQDYLNPGISSISPVGSALADTIKEIEGAVDHEELALEDLESVKLPTQASKRVRGAINLVRVSLLHARASKFEESPEDIYEGTFASTRLSGADSEFAKQIFQSQDRVIYEFLTAPHSPPAELIAELGLSIETLTDLREWVHSLADWQIENCSQLLYGGHVNAAQARYILGPVAKNMAELEGPKLGGFLSEIILLWLSGVPFNTIWAGKKEFWRTDRIEDLISVVYSRVQYLLPWGLYAADRLVESEASRRRIVYQNDIRALAYLADAGVPSFNARRLVSFDIERADATRLSENYRAEGGLNTGMDIFQWLVSQSLEAVFKCVRGKDKRRIDYDLERRLKDIAAAVE